MRILYDGRVFEMQTTGGISRYFANIIDRLPQTCCPTLTTIDDGSKFNYPHSPNLELVKQKKNRPHWLSNRAQKRFLPNVADSQVFNLAHPTYYTLLTGEDIGSYRFPVVLTVHDMIHELFASKLDPTGRHAEAKRKAVSAAHAILCVSNNTKQDLLNLCNVPEEKVHVTYLASSLNESFAYGDEPTPSRPYYLYVGSRDHAYKNFDGLLRALVKAVSINPEMSLCVIGVPFGWREKALIASLKIGKHIEHYGQVTDTHLAKLYRCSVAFVYPSLYEGFGIPPLEAMACGAPVIAAHSSSIPEVIGNAGLLFDPKDIGELADQLLFLLDHPLERDRLIAKGLERHKQFSWDKTIAQTLEVYRTVAN